MSARWSEVSSLADCPQRFACDCGCGRMACIMVEHYDGSKRAGVDLLSNVCQPVYEIRTEVTT